MQKRFGSKYGILKLVQQYILINDFNCFQRRILQNILREKAAEYVSHFENRHHFLEKNPLCLIENYGQAFELLPLQLAELCVAVGANRQGRRFEF